jgi:hypothetical protein
MWFQESRNYEDAQVLQIALPQVPFTMPERWGTKAKERGWPNVARQGNVITAEISRKLGIKVEDIPRITPNSRIQPPLSKTFKEGAFVIHFYNTKDATNVRKRLTDKGVEVTGYHPMMIKVESSGWDIRDSVEQINRRVQATMNAHQSRGLTCVSKNNSRAGTAQFYVPIYEINNLQLLTTTNGKKPSLWFKVGKQEDVRCPNCHVIGDHKQDQCHADRKCPSCDGNCKRGECPEYMRPRCQWQDCATGKNHNSYHCPKWKGKRTKIDFSKNSSLPKQEQHLNLPPRLPQVVGYAPPSVQQPRPSQSQQQPPQPRPQLQSAAEPEPEPFPLLSSGEQREQRRQQQRPQDRHNQQPQQQPLPTMDNLYKMISEAVAHEFAKQKTQQGVAMHDKGYQKLQTKYNKLERLVAEQTKLLAEQAKQIAELTAAKGKLEMQTLAKAGLESSSSFPSTPIKQSPPRKIQKKRNRTPEPQPTKEEKEQRAHWEAAKSNAPSNKPVLPQSINKVYVQGSAMRLTAKPHDGEAN